VIYSLFYIDLLGSACTASGCSHPVKFMYNLVLLEDWHKSSTAVLNDVTHEETFPLLFTLLQSYSYFHIVLYSLRNYYVFICCFVDSLCVLVVRVPGYRSRGPGSIPGTTRCSEK
jgi:hypothetical protein